MLCLCEFESSCRLRMYFKTSQSSYAMLLAPASQFLTKCDLLAHLSMQRLVSIGWFHTFLAWMAGTQISNCVWKTLMGETRQSVKIKIGVVNEIKQVSSESIWQSSLMHSLCIAQLLASLLPDPAVPGSIPSVFPEVNQRRCLEESGQWLENVGWTQEVPLVIAV